MVLEGDPLPEGVFVTVLAEDEPTEGFAVSAREEEHLLAAIAEAEAGNTVDAQTVLRELDGR